MSRREEYAAQSSRAAREKLLPFLLERQAELPFGRLTITQDSDEPLARIFDLFAKADGFGQVGSTIYPVGLRCQQTGKDEAAHSVRWPQEWNAYQEALRTEALAATWLVQAFFSAQYASLISVYVTPMRAVCDVIRDHWKPQYDTPPLRRAGDGSGDQFAYAYWTALRGWSGALRLAPDYNLRLF